MVDPKKLQEMLLSEEHKLSEEEKELMKLLWEEYKKNKHELEEIKDLGDYNEQIKKELHAAFKDMHNNKLRQSAEELNTLKGKIEHSRLFIMHLEKERAKRPAEDAKLAQITHKLNHEVIIMLECTSKLIEKVIGFVR